MENIDNEFNNPAVPAWAIKLILQKMKYSRRQV